jgi:hypothetical protein
LNDDDIGVIVKVDSCRWHTAYQTNPKDKRFQKSVQIAIDLLTKTC